MKLLRTRSWAALSFAALPMVACGSGGGAFESEVPPFTAGSRLSPRFLDAGGGARVLFDFYDHELGTSCSFYPTPEGTFRCLPQPSFSGNLDQCGAPAFAPVVETNDCGGHVATGAVKAPAGTPPPQPLQDLREREAFGGLTWEGAWMGATVVPLEHFVAGHVTSVTLEGDLAAERIVADDGASVTIGFTRKGSSCAPTWFGGELRCLDAREATLEQHAGDQLFVGPGCSSDRAAEYASQCGLPKPILATSQTQDASVCPGDAHHFELLEDVGEVSLSWSPGQCLDAIEGDATFARVGAEVPASALPALKTVEAGVGRLRVQLMTGGGSALGSTTMRSGSNDRGFFDTQLGAACTAQLTADGEVRCIPGGASPSGFWYADPGCSQELMFGDAERCGVVTDNRFVPRGVSRECGSGLAPSEVLERGEVFVGWVYAVGGNGMCFGHGESDGGFFRPGAVHPLEDFAVVSLTE